MNTRNFMLPVLILGLAVSAPAFDLGGALQKVGEKAVTDPNAQKGFTGLTMQEEIDIGDAVSVQIVSRYGGVWKDQVATQRINLVGKTLAHYAKRDRMDWRFGLLNSNAVNAFSAPNGRVFITKGLYQLLDNDDELAGVLAHEIAHIEGRHAAKIIAGQQATGALVGAGAEVAGDQIGNQIPAGLSEVSKKVEESVAKAITGILTKGYGSGKEYEADKDGYELAKVCGFNPDGLRADLIKVDANSPKTKETFSTHPSTKDRLKRLPGGEGDGKKKK
jgi:predicted Zn-dependent protease